MRTALEQLNWRILNSIAFLSTLALMLGAFFYFQRYLNLPPCNLCILQRIGTMVVAVFFLVLVIWNPKPLAHRVVAALGAFAAFVVAGIALYHVYLQNLPPELVPACGPNIGYMMEAFGFWEALMEVFASPGDCAEVHWRFLGLSIPGWVAVWLLGYGLLLSAQVIWPKWPWVAAKR